MEYYKFTCTSFRLKECEWNERKGDGCKPNRTFGLLLIERKVNEQIISTPTETKK